MRVLYLYKDYAPVFGGIENHIRDLAEGLRRVYAVDTRVLATNTGARTVEETIGGVPVVKTGRQLNISSAPVSVGYGRWLRRLEATTDIVHAHAPYPPAEMAHLVFGYNRPFVVTYHSDIVRQRVLGTFYSPILRQVLRRADRVVVSNPSYIESSAFLRAVRQKCVVIPFGVDLSRFQATPELAERSALLRTRWGDRPLLLFVGRLRHYKGIDVLIRALTTLPEPHLLVVGIGPMESAWRQQVQEAGLADRITFAGELADEEVVVAYHAADIFVLPSSNRAETFGIVQTEAMAAGLPVISTELGTGTSWVNQHDRTGLVVPAGDATALAGAIGQLLADPERRHRMAQTARVRAEQEFSQAAMVRRMYNLYQELYPSLGT
jgi:rhamnosyl/mannosyltransferase